MVQSLSNICEKELVKLLAYVQLRGLKSSHMDPVLLVCYFVWPLSILCVWNSCPSHIHGPRLSVCIRRGLQAMEQLDQGVLCELPAVWTVGAHPRAGAARLLL